MKLENVLALLESLEKEKVQNTFHIMNKFTKAQLMAIAEQKGLSVSPKATKTDIINIINQKGKVPEKESNPFPGEY